MKRQKAILLVGDFETTTYADIEHTEVWASAVVEFFSEDVKIFHSIEETFEYLSSKKNNVIIYYHNLKFDGAFWLDYLITKLKFKQAYTQENNDIQTTKFISKNKMTNNTFTYSIADTGQWYQIIIKVNNKYITILDSYKLLPFKLERIGESFKTKHKKLSIEYTGYRYAGCEITDEEKSYIANDVLVIKEALEIMYEQGHTNITIGSCCLEEYKNIITKQRYDNLFPNLYEFSLDEAIYGSKTVGDYIRKSYRGGWCYLVRGKENKIFYNGTTADVNSLYPSMMSSESGNKYPVGLPVFWQGSKIPDEALKEDSYYFIRINTRFYLKDNKLPFVQLKNSLRYDPTSMLETSDVVNPRNGMYSKKIITIDGEEKIASVTLTLTMTDYILLKEQYHLVDCKILDGCYFKSKIGIFDDYIEKYKKIKLESKGALRELAKLFLNNLYGKMAASTDSSFKVAYIKDDNSIGFYTVKANDKKPGYIPVGTAITSYARNFTIRAAQANYHGVDKPGFIYADTDSIHCDLSPDELRGVKEDSKNFCCWKFESCWDTAFFTRAKTYIEHVTHENREKIDEPYFNVKCAGMPDKSKDLFIISITQDFPENADKKYQKYEIEWAKEKRTLNDFKVGLSVPGKLRPKRIPGGIVLVDTPYIMR